VSDDHDVAAAAAAVAQAIGRRDLGALRDLLAPGFSHRTAAGGLTTAEVFLEGVAAFPGAIESIGVEHLQVEVVGNVALVTGTQHARVVVDGATVEDRQGFVDCFVRDGDGWRLRAAFQL
jgi:ketosteroid isomerase-like protein